MSPRKNYLDELARIQQRINALFEQALLSTELEDGRELSPPGCWSPAVDVLETEDGYSVHAELAGVRREDIDLQAEERRLEISGRRQPAEEHRSFLRMERSYGRFRRVFELAEPIDVDGVTAQFERGVLRVSVPKRRPEGIKIIPRQEV
ncbi:MAG TPA: Hsp20/alpha crystallin family protein [Thermoanaerobaculia bacterium]|nr:Hsp20/alpha crystallin family protein [Thermoanaerobaculia bacterium]